MEFKKFDSLTKSWQQKFIANSWCPTLARSANKLLRRLGVMQPRLGSVRFFTATGIQIQRNTFKKLELRDA